jgi:conjugal transfer/type IV secretion protein DotA/TraY
MAQMPFSPCVEGSDCHDVSVEVLRWIFGGVIDKLTTGANPDDAQAATSLFGALFQVWGNGVLTVAAFIVAYIAMMGVANTANDGEAMGKNWSSVYTPARVVAYGGVLLPTASGYSFLQLIVMMLALWGIGLANQIQAIGIKQGLLGGALTSVSPMLGMGEEATANKNYPLYDLRVVAENYLSVAWCQKTLTAVYSNHESGSPDIKTADDPDQTLVAADKNTYTYNYADRNASTKLGGGAPLCGAIQTFQIKNLPTNADTSADKSLTGQATSEERQNAMKATILELRLTAAAAKSSAANQMISRLNTWVSTWPNTIEDEGWQNINLQQFNTIVNEAQDNLIGEMNTKIGENKKMAGILKTYLDDLTVDGWAMMGGFYQRMGDARALMGSFYSEPVMTIIPPELSALPNDPYGEAARISYKTINDLVLIKSISLQNGTAESALSFRCSQSSLSSLLSLDKDVISGFFSAINTYLNQCISSVLTKGTETLTGTSTDVDAIVRIKQTGEFFATVKGISEGIGTAAHMGLFAVSATAAIGGGTTAFFYDTHAALDAARFMLEHIFFEPVKWIGSLSDLFAFYFGVLLPSMPYTIFIIAVVGFFIAVLQSIVASSLWAVMHMTPDRTFIGSQSQGYLLLLSLFVRPSLLTIGLFASFQMINPVVAFTSKAFWSTYSAITQDENVFAQFAQWKNWVAVYGMVLLPVVYMVFGLGASLADDVLTWIGHGVKPLGQTEAVSQMQQRSERHGYDSEANKKNTPSNKPASKTAGGGGDGKGGGGNGKGSEPATGGNTQAPAPVPTVGGDLN